MILNNNFSTQYLDDYKNNRIQQGLGIGSPAFDTHVRHKQSELNVVLGLDNVGKTAVIMWYFLALSVKHGLRWCIWSGENKPAQQVRQLMEMMSGVRLKNMTDMQISKYREQVEYYFLFVDPSKMYDSKQLLDIFAAEDVHGCLIDPFTGLNHDRRKNQFDNTYEFLNASRQFCNSTQKTIYINQHCVTEATRRMYPANHDLSGHIQTPLKSHAEMGQAWANRCDNFHILHRLTQHPIHRYTTQWNVTKVKDVETGGQTTILDEPLQLDFNAGMGFVINGQNVLNDFRESPKQINTDWTNTDSDEWE